MGFKPGLCLEVKYIRSSFSKLVECHFEHQSPDLVMAPVQGVYLEADLLIRHL